MELVARALESLPVRITRMVAFGALRRCQRNMGLYRATGLTYQWALDCVSFPTTLVPLRRFSIGTARRVVPLTPRMRSSMRAAVFASALPQTCGRLLLGARWQQRFSKPSEGDFKASAICEDHTSRSQ